MRQWPSQLRLSGEMMGNAVLSDFAALDLLWTQPCRDKEGKIFFFFTSGPSAWKRKFETCHQRNSKVTEFSLTAGWKSFRLVCLPPGVNSLCLLSVITLQGTQLLLCLSIQFQQHKVTNTRGAFQYWLLDGCSWGTWLSDCLLSSFWNVLSGWKTWTLPGLCVNPHVV